MYIKVSGSIITYPYTLDDFKRDYSNISFPKHLTTEVLENFYTYEVIPTNIDDDYSKNIIEDTPIKSGSVYVQTWLITSASAEEISQRKEEEWDIIREKRNNLLNGCDWTQFQDTPISGSKLTEWQTYRQSLRDITNQSNPFEVSWPTKPE